MINIDILCEQLRGLIIATRDKSLTDGAINTTLEALIYQIRYSEFVRGFKDAFGPYHISDDILKSYFEGATNDV